MIETLSFQTDAAIVTRLGRELVAKQETALIELVKNGFDADATAVDVVFTESGDGPIAVEIKDNGAGMTRSELINGFMRLASDLKAQSPNSPQFGRRRAGRKGIGRFATQRLGDRLILTTCTSRATSGLRLTVNWRDFVGGRRLEDVSVELEEIAAQKAGTTMRIELLRDNWSPSQIRNCWRGVLALQQPFPVVPVENRITADPGFTVRFLQSGGLFEDESIVADMQTEILDHLHAVVDMEVDDNGAARWRISRNRLGPTQDWQPIHHKFRDQLEVPNYNFLRSAAMKSYYVVLDPMLLPSLVFTRVRDVLSQEGGIRLYRNGFRVVPYGEPDNDWLGLDAAYAKRAALAPFANRNFFGIVELRDSSTDAFEEHTSREGLIDTPAFTELKGLASSVLITAATQIARDRGRKTHAGGRSTPKLPAPLSSGFEELSAAAKATRDAAERISRGVENVDVVAVAKHAAETVKLIEEQQVQIEEKKAQIADEAAMLRFLATLGMTTAEFTHETGMTFDAFRLDFQRVFDVALQQNRDDAFVTQAQRAQAMLRRLETLTSYLNSLAAARSLRGMMPISLSKAVEDFERGLGDQARSQNVELTIETPPYDPLFTRPMHQAEIASILLNFYTNAMKAMKRSNADRRILIVVDRTPESDRDVRIRFSDTGDGVPLINREKVFDAFFTTVVAPAASATDVEHASGTGLGLWIVSQIINNVDGSVSIVDPPSGYSTCFEVLLSAEDEGNV